LSDDDAASVAQNHSGCQLLSFDNIARNMDFEVRLAFATQKTYSNQISSAFDHNLLKAASAETRLWLESWPPTLGSSAQSVDSTSAPAGDFAMATPAEYCPNTLGANGAAKGASNDPLLNRMLWILN